jgi:tRNA (cmo5U34)-methyltransferase
MSNDKRDKLYADRHDMIVDFAFDESVANVFPDMIRRSVPGYDAIITHLGLFARQYALPNTRLYDLGCSTGAATLALRRQIQVTGCEIIAVDNAEAMVQTCQQNISHDKSQTPVQAICADIQDVTIENASVVVLNFTLQFIAPEKRQALLQKIYQGMVAGGVLVLAEKLVFNDTQKQQFVEDMHMAYKKANGYSDLEISQKRTALENVLVPDTMSTHIQRLEAIGFTQIYPWFRCFNFAALCAIK